MSEPERNPASALLLAGAVPSSTATVVSLVVAGLLAGGAAAASAGVGGLLALVALAVGPLVMRGGQRMSPPGLLAAAVLAYGCVVVALGAAYGVLDLADWFRGLPAGLGMLVGGTAWLGGQLHRTRHLRVLVFGSTDSRRG